MPSPCRRARARTAARSGRVRGRQRAKGTARSSRASRGATRRRRSHRRRNCRAGQQAPMTKPSSTEGIASSTSGSVTTHGDLVRRVAMPVVVIVRQDGRVCGGASCRGRRGNAAERCTSGRAATNTAASGRNRRSRIPAAFLVDRLDDAVLSRSREERRADQGQHRRRERIRVIGMRRHKAAHVADVLVVVHAA